MSRTIGYVLAFVMVALAGLGITGQAGMLRNPEDEGALYKIDRLMDSSFSFITYGAMLIGAFFMLYLVFTYVPAPQSFQSFPQTTQFQY